MGVALRTEDVVAQLHGRSDGVLRVAEQVAADPTTTEETSALLLDIIALEAPHQTVLRTNAALAQAKTAPNDPRTLAVLLDVVQPQYSPESPTAATPNTHVLLLLTPLLWTLQEDDSLVLTDRRRAQLRAVLRSLWRLPGDLAPWQADFYAAAVKALALQGEGEPGGWFERGLGTATMAKNRAFARSIADECRASATKNAAQARGNYRRLREMIASWRAIKPAAVEKFLASLSEAEAKAVLLRYLAAERGRVTAVQTALTATVIGLCLGGAIYNILAVRAAGDFPGVVLFIGMVTLFCCIGMYSLAYNVFNQWRLARHAGPHVAARSLGSFADTRLVGPMIDALESNGVTVLIEPLTHRLRDMKPGDGIYLQPRHLRFLRQAIGEWMGARKESRYDRAFVLAALHAIVIAGDLHAYPVVMRLADIPPAKKMGPIRAAAAAALLRLNAVKQWRAELKQK